MADRRHLDLLLEKGAQADRNAAKARGEHAKASWTFIAASYRRLAEIVRQM